ncbi:MAG: 50S ribosomal protein L14 [Candidatus Stahlbacteria bacterium]|nr:50S ribosomal protein L14 [Candidatus Stahlbacteria bacterium]
MIQKFTRLKVIDNSGAKIAMCIGIVGGGVRRYATIGDIITIVVKDAIPSSPVADGSVQKAVITRTKKEYRRKDGTYIRFDENACVLINKENEPMGTRVFGPIAREIREKKFMRIASLAPELV